MGPDAFDTLADVGLTDASDTEDTTTATDDVDSQVLAGYRNALTAFEDAAAIPDPDFPALMATRMGKSLDKARRGLSDLRDGGLKVRRGTHSTDVSRATVRDVVGAQAEIDDCHIDDAVVLDASNGRVVNDIVETWRYQVVMTLVDGTWKVSQLNSDRQWSGVAGCAR